MAANATKLFVCSLSLLFILIAYYYRKYNDDLLRERLQSTLNNLLKAENSVKLTYKPKVGLGFGSCQDVVIQSSEIILNEEAPELSEHFDSIQNKEELLKVFAYFFKHGAAAERYISNETLFNEILESVKNSENSKWTVGGNAPIMALRFAKEGCDVLLGAQLSLELKKILPSNMIFSGPLIEKDDIHLLLEYSSGEHWGTYTAPRANRFIVHNDHQNPTLISLESFDSELDKFKPNLLVVGGLQMMDNFPLPLDVRKSRLQKVQDMLARQPKTTRIHFEMASFTDKTLMSDLIESIIPMSDSLGMNEQELPNLYHMIMYKNITLVSESYPRVAIILDQMRDVFRLLQDTEEVNGRRKLTRLHVHTLAFQAIMTKKKSSWKNSMSAAAKAALTAHRHTCGSDEIDADKAKLIMDDSFTTSRGKNAKKIIFEAKKPVACWEEDDIEICVAPVLVCTEVLQTGGGGDNVSSAGLVLQI
ncbi:ADP-dependent glucokinase-like [Centruroides sculpturatus]|uniref:ADP-dependent glucokinase-like n=1 Tax=Centruroides sculpturatus TaxID=218467 RepID=UPI000C6E755F|nr:ADP-dependent glucokinase-like [Centruroides sculpturatus]